MSKDKLYDYFFHYNIYTKEWNAVRRDQSIHYLNGTLKKGEVLKHKDKDVLIKLITK